MIKADIEKLSIPELLAKKKQTNKLAYSVLLGLLVFASVIFYLMYNGQKEMGNLLFFVPVIGFLLAIYTGRTINQINAELNKRLK